MSEDPPPQDSLEELFEDAPCGYLTTEPDGRIVRANRTFQRWTGFEDSQLAGRRFQELLSKGARVYYETHYAPLLQMHGRVSEIAFNLVCADQRRLPTLVNSIVRHDEHGHATSVRTIVFKATDRRRYEQELLAARRAEQQIAQQLQAGLLAGELPRAGGLQIEVAYRPAVHGLQVGGDWYDAFWLQEDQTLAVVIGDVVGQGIGAATAMGQLRSAIRALAPEASGPAQVIDRVDRYSRRHQVGRYCTLVYAQLTLATGELTYACAGHPPPLLIPPGASPQLLWEGRSAPIDAYVDAAARPEGALTLAPGSTLLLYTDGLVERRGESLDHGLQQLTHQAAQHRDRPLGELVSTIAGALSATAHPDDICLLALRRGGSPPPAAGRPAADAGDEE